MQIRNMVYFASVGFDQCKNQVKAIYLIFSWLNNREF